MKKTSKLSVILSAVNAVLCSVNAVIDIANGKHKSSPVWFIVDILDIFVWLATFGLQLDMYRSNRSEE